VTRLASPRRSRVRLTPAGTVILQSLFIFIALAVELTLVSSVGRITGIALLLAFAGGAFLTRPAAQSWGAVTPPIAVGFSLLLLLPSLGTSSLSIASLSVDALNSLAALAPFLVVGAAGAWANIWFRSR
jgi:hypothetical protein